MTHYATLGVSPGATAEELHTAYKQLALRYHPDRKGGDTEKFAGITAAYAVLKDVKRRRQYDAELKLRGRQCAACGGTGQRLVQKGFTRQTWQRCAVCKGTGEAR